MARQELEDAAMGQTSPPSPRTVHEPVLLPAHPGHAEEDAWTEGDCCLHVREPGWEMMGGAGGRHDGLDGELSSSSRSSLPRTRTARPCFSTPPVLSGTPLPSPDQTTNLLLHQVQEVFHLFIP